MGAASSVVGSGATDDCKKFVDCFIGLSQKGEENKAARRQSWMACDYNGNGYCSLAEVDGWVKKTLQFDEGTDEGDRLWDLFRPCIIRAFNDAKDVAPEREMKTSGDATSDDYVTKHEFRILNAYLCIYGTVWDAFNMMDGGSAGTTAEDDRRINLEEWTNGYEKVANHGFVGLAKIADESTEDSVESVFNEIDTNGGGFILLNEFAAWIATKETEAETQIGFLLNVGDD